MVWIGRGGASERLRRCERGRACLCARLHNRTVLTGIILRHLGPSHARGMCLS